MWKGSPVATPDLAVPLSSMEHFSLFEMQLYCSISLRFRRLLSITLLQKQSCIYPLKTCIKIIRTSPPKYVGKTPAYIRPWNRLYLSLFSSEIGEFALWMCRVNAGASGRWWLACWLDQPWTVPQFWVALSQEGGAIGSLPILGPAYSGWDEPVSLLLLYRPSR